MSESYNKERIEFILNLLEEEVDTYKEVEQLFCNEFSVSHSIFNKYWKEAKAIYSEVNSEILTENESLKILTDVARGKSSSSISKASEPKAADRLKAIQMLKEWHQWGSTQDVDTQESNKIVILDNDRGREIFV
jgi:hypothetical protein